MSGNVGGEFVVAAAQVLHECVTGCNRPCRGEAFQSAHRPKSGLQPAVIGFHQVVGILLDHVTRARDVLIDDARVGRCSIGRDLDRSGTQPQRAYLEAGQARGKIAIAV
jgi:hypothetical protein